VIIKYDFTINKSNGTVDVIKNINKFTFNEEAIMSFKINSNSN